MADAPALELRFGPAAAADPSLRDRLYGTLDDFEPTAIHEDDEAHAWRVFFRSSAGRDAALAAVRRLAAPAQFDVRPLEVPDEDWARRSQESLRAVRVGGLIVAPPWDTGFGKRAQPAGDVPLIIIEPSTGFGTGHHATTRLCLRLLQSLDVRGARVIDVGTGSGVLALAAWKLGAADVVAVDSDQDALDNARANIARNGAGAAIDIVPEQLERLRLEPADVVLANLTAAVIFRNTAVLQAVTREPGVLILSGFSPAEAPTLHAAFRTGTATSVQEEDWAALMLT
ncbi:MAG TPA: 50S ribosomal protein L11 methyltransferase [Vicinamibacterales bacterium]|nr:50S ribosomal protein L11 methyltransferase [Vicinamibacterales bacterium]